MIKEQAKRTNATIMQRGDEITNAKRNVKEEICPTCGGDGIAGCIYYSEGWDEDVSARNLIRCPNCGGSGLANETITGLED